VPWFQILVMLLILAVLFGRGRTRDIMGDVGKGVKSFRKALTDDDESPHAETVQTVEVQPSPDPTGK
jgi:sec-independent protein translocase protein TatA